MRRNATRKIFMLILLFFSCFMCIYITSIGRINTNKVYSKNIHTITNTEDLLAFAHSVNNGYSYKDSYILQTSDIDLEGIEWETIGSFDSEYSFMGTYNGDGHIIKNISVNKGGNNSFFGKLGGTVMNLGVESGKIMGACVGGITSHSSDSNAIIINCYNRATVQGTRAGGIADNFDGTIANCLSECDLQGNSLGGIVSYDAKAIINSISIEEIGRSIISHEGIEYIDKNNIDYLDIIEKLNGNIYYSANVAGIDYHELNFWELLEEENKIVLSKDKASIEINYIDNYIKASLSSWFPFLLIIVSICFMVVIIHNSYKRETI